MRPTFGCKLRYYVFDQYTQNDRQLIINEVMNVVSADPRVDYVSSTISDVPYGIIIAVNLFYKQINVSATLLVNFNSETDALYGFSGT